MDQWRAGRAVCGDFDDAQTREWLVTNGRGGYASGTIAGALTRRYHGLLVAALEPPVGRRLVVAKCELEVTYDNVTYALATNLWLSGDISPRGYQLCESFALVDGVPTWTYLCGDATLEQTIAMPHDRDATALALRVTRARGPVDITARLLVADRDHHGGPLPEPSSFAVVCDTESASIALPLCARTLHILAPGATLRPASERYTGFALVREAERGLQASDDFAHLATFRQTLVPGATGGCVVSLDAAVAPYAGEHVAAAQSAHRQRVAAAATPQLGRLAAAADAFIVRRDNATPAAGTTVIAGYHWFADWGRDTMIALPGLTLNTGRPEVAREVLFTFADSIDDGMLPNRFPEDGSPPEYNTVDAALWFIEAARAYFAATADVAFVRRVFAALDAIVAAYRRGTRYGIGVDSDGLLRAGTPGMQLTWMDAKVGDWVVTPRIGKPVEVNALWYAGLRTLAALAPVAGRPAEVYAQCAERCAVGFGRFWNAERGYCYDVIDGPDGNDPALRPNQLFAVALHAPAIEGARTRGIVDACARELLTSYGLRTLGPREPGYCERYDGDARSRDGAYHQGTVWPWLIGAFARAHLRVYGNVAVARSFALPLLDALNAYGLGTLGEIFEGAPPHVARGTIAQAWSVAELISLVAPGVLEKSL